MHFLTSYLLRHSITMFSMCIRSVSVTKMYRIVGRPARHIFRSCRFILSAKIARDDGIATDDRHDGDNFLFAVVFVLGDGRFFCRSSGSLVFLLSALSVFFVFALPRYSLIPVSKSPMTFAP